MPENNGKRNLNKYQKHIACSYGYKSVCIDDKFNKPFRIYLGEDTVYNFINSMIEESKYSNDVIKHFNKELVMAKEDNENFNSSTKGWICDNNYIDNDVEVRDPCHIKGKYRSIAQADCDIKF